MPLRARVVMAKFAVETESGRAGVGSPDTWRPRATRKRWFGCGRCADSTEDEVCGRSGGTTGETPMIIMQTMRYRTRHGVGTAGTGEERDGERQDGHSAREPARDKVAGGGARMDAGLGGSGEVHIRPTDGGRRLSGKLRGHAAGRWGTIGRRWWARQCTRPRGCVSATALSCSELFPVPGAAAATARVQVREGGRGRRGRAR